MYPRKPPALAPPPRPVSLGARLAVSLGSVLALVGVGMALFGSLFFWIFAARSEALTVLEFRGETRQARGVVLGSEATSSSENDETVYAIRFRYDVSGRSFEGESYVVGGTIPASQEVAIDYLAAEPATARIRGLRRRPFSAGAAFVVILPLVGLGLLAGAVPPGLRKARLLRIGALDFAKLVGTKETNVWVNDRRVYALTFRLELPPPEPAPGGYRAAAAPARPVLHEFTVKTHETEKVGGEAREAVLYDPANPRDAAPLDLLPVLATPEGGFRARSVLLPALAFLGLALLVAANALVAALSLA